MKLTKSAIDKLEKTDNRHGTRYQDDKLTGFGITVYPSGRKVFFIQYGPSDRRKRMNIGDYGVLTPAQARDRATVLLSQVALGVDPKEMQQAKREAEKLTFRVWAEQYAERCLAGGRRRSMRDDRRFFKMANSAFGSLPLVKVCPTDVQKVFDMLTNEGTPIQANRWLAAVRACLEEAWRLDMIPENPARRPRPNPEGDPRTRYLNDDEMKRLVKAIEKEKDPHVRAAFYLLIGTGARLGQVRRAEWEHFDLERNTWTIPSSHSKSKREILLPLNTELAEYLGGIDRVSKFVLPSRSGLNPRRDFKRPWARVKEEAKLSDVRIHDLRRTFGQYIRRAATLEVASRLLGHASTKVTDEHYTAPDLEEMAAAVNGALGNIVPFPVKKNSGE